VRNESLRDPYKSKSSNSQGRLSNRLNSPTAGRRHLWGLRGSSQDSGVCKVQYSTPYPYRPYCAVLCSVARSGAGQLGKGRQKSIRFASLCHFQVCVVAGAPSLFLPSLPKHEPWEKLTNLTIKRKPMVQAASQLSG
jgi:hypothetical protein